MIKQAHSVYSGIFQSRHVGLWSCSNCKTRNLNIGPTNTSYCTTKDMAKIQPEHKISQWRKNSRVKLGLICLVCMPTLHDYTFDVT